MLDQLLWRGKNRWQMGSAFLGAFIGLLLFLLPLQLYFDIQTVLNKTDGTGEAYVMINKPVNLLNTMGLKSGFSDKNIEELEAQSFISQVGEFTSNQFKVSASSKMIGFYTELFFEAVPDDFLDHQSPAWEWKEGDIHVPIIMARDYLALYNFGFAPSQGLPQFTPSTINSFSFDIGLSGNGKRADFRGKVVGFSDRINSILVPQNFMDWANTELGNGSGKASSRLILKTDDPYSEDLASFLKKKGYEVSRGKLIGGQLGTLLNGVLSVIATIGFLIFILSLLIFILSFRLIISESRDKIELLLQLGYRPSSIIRSLNKKLFHLILGIGTSTLLVLFPLKLAIARWFTNQGFEVYNGISFRVIASAFLVCFLFYVLNHYFIKSSVRR